MISDAALVFQSDRIGLKATDQKETRAAWFSRMRPNLPRATPAPTQHGFRKP